MKGIWLIVLLLGLLVAGYLVMEDMKSKQETGSSNISAIEKAKAVEKKVEQASKAQEDRIKNILGE